MDNKIELDIQRFANPKLVIDAVLNRKNFENGLDKMKSSTQKAGSTIKNIVVGLGITKLIGSAMNTITGSIDGAISRLDTLNQFPKVMSNLGIGAEDAEKSIKKMSDKLSGLPTTLDEGARAVQRFTSKNSDVAKSTDLFLALNNAILAGGASSEIQSSALEQLSQAYAKGKPDMMEWRTAMTAMPAQLKQVAQAMGYVDADALGEALREGSVSMDEFMDTITKLNTEGVNGFQSFEEQARNSTGGIATSITVAKTQVVKGVTDIIEALNTKLGDIGLGGIGDVISTAGKKAKEGLDVIAKLITGEMSISQFITMGTDAITGFIDGFISNIPMIIDTAKKLIDDFIVGFKENAPKLISSALDLILALVDAFLDNLDYIIDLALDIVVTLGEALVDATPRLIEKIPEIIEKLIKALIDNGPKILQALLDLAISLVGAVLSSIGSLILDGLNAVFGGLITWFKELPSKIGDFINQVIEVFKNLPYYIGYLIGWLIAKGAEFLFVTLPNFINGIIEWFKELPGKIWDWLVQTAINLSLWTIDMYNRAKQGISNLIEGIKQWFKDLPSNMANIGKNIVKGIWNGIKNAKDWLLDKIKSFAKGIKDGIKKALGIKSPSRVMRDEVGKYLAQGIGVGFEDEIDSVYKSMQNAIDLEQSKLQANVETGKVFNTLQNSTPVAIDINADVEMDGTRVGRLITPVISKTIKTGGGV